MKMNIISSNSSADWGEYEFDLSASLKKVHEFGVSIGCNGSPGYAGSVFIDDFRITQ